MLSFSLDLTVLACVVVIAVGDVVFDVTVIVAVVAVLIVIVVVVGAIELAVVINKVVYSVTKLISGHKIETHKQRLDDNLSCFTTSTAKQVLEPGCY